MATKITTHRELDVYKKAFEAAIIIYELTEQLPAVERYSLTDQVRRSSRSVCANIAEAWRKRRYERSFVSKLSDAEAEAAETQVWLEFAQRFSYTTDIITRDLDQRYDEILRMLVSMMNHSEQWCLTPLKENEIKYQLDARDGA